jgi:hypothetical protein
MVLAPHFRGGGLRPDTSPFFIKNDEKQPFQMNTQELNYEKADRNTICPDFCLERLHNAYIEDPYSSCDCCYGYKSAE